MVKFNTYLNILTFGSSPSPFATSCLRTNPGARLLIFHSKIFLSHKKSLRLKIFKDVIVHVICKLGPPIQNSGYTLCQNLRNFYVWLFSFQPIKKQCCPRAENRTFSRLVAFKAKDFKCFLEEVLKTRDVLEDSTSDYKA